MGVKGGFEGAEISVNYAAHNAADALRLKTTLALQNAGLLDRAGYLTESAIDRSIIVMSEGSIFKNQSVIDALTKGGSQITDWQKLSTGSIEMPTGQRIQVHSYRNKITGEVNYTHPDFKVKNPVNLFSKMRQPGSMVRPPYRFY